MDVNDELFIKIANQSYMLYPSRLSKRFIKLEVNKYIKHKGKRE